MKTKYIISDGIRIPIQKFTIMFMETYTHSLNLEKEGYEMFEFPISYEEMYKEFNKSKFKKKVVAFTNQTIGSNNEISIIESKGKWQLKNRDYNMEMSQFGSGTISLLALFSKMFSLKYNQKIHFNNIDCHLHELSKRQLGKIFYTFGTRSHAKIIIETMRSGFIEGLNSERGNIFDDFVICNKFENYSGIKRCHTFNLINEVVDIGEHVESEIRNH